MGTRPHYPRPFRVLPEWAIKTGLPSRNRKPGGARSKSYTHEGGETVQKVRTGQVVGLLAVAALLAALDAIVGLGAVGWAVGLICGVVISCALARGLARGGDDALRP